MNILEQTAEKLKKHEEFALVIVVETTGSVPAKVGFRMIVSAESIKGTVGGGALENDIIAQARTLLSKNGEPCLVKINLSDINMQCGGEVTCFIEPFCSKKSLWIFGGGHISAELVPLAISVGFQVTVADDRPEFAARDRFPNAFQILNTPYREASRIVPSDSFVVIVTHKHTHDQEILFEVAKHKPPLPYIGMIGSKKKVRLILDKLKTQGPVLGKNIYSPIGLDIGGGSPAEIAISVISELMGVLNKKSNLPHCRNHLR